MLKLLPDSNAAIWRLPYVQGRSVAEFCFGLAVAFSDGIDSCLQGYSKALLTAYESDLFFSNRGLFLGNAFRCALIGRAATERRWHACFPSEEF
jgi:hypothetical protein